MKRTIFLSVMVIAISVVFISCGTLFTKGGSAYRSGVSAYERQQYVSSLQSLSDALSVNPEFEEAAQLFPKVFVEGTSYYKNQVAAFAGRNDLQSIDRVYHAYVNLQDLHTIAGVSGRGGITIEDFSQELQEIRLISADMWFENGQNLQQKGDRESLKQAVAAYETARSRNPNLPNIDNLIATALEKATVTVAIVAHGSSIAGLSEKVVKDVTDILSQNRFVRVLPYRDFTPGEESMVGPLDIAIMEGMGKGWNYVLEVYTYQGFEEINKEEPVILPSAEPLFSGVKKTLGYKHNTSISYRLFNIKRGVAIEFEDQIREVDGPYEYTFSYVQSEGLRELNLGGTGKKNLRFVTSNADDIRTNSSISTLRWDYENIEIPIEISDPTDQTQWISYFTRKYDDFETFVRNESERELFYAIEVVHHRPSDTYYTIGPNLDEAIRRSKINSAIMNALSYTGRKLIEEEKKAGGSGYLKAGKLAANAIKDLL